MDQTASNWIHPHGRQSLHLWLLFQVVGGKDHRHYITVNLSVLVFNGVILTRQEQGITLQSRCSDHKLLYSPDYWQGFFVNLCILLLSFSECPWSKGYRPGRSVPAFITWDSTVSMPTGDASQANYSGRLGSYCVRTCSGVIISFTLGNAASHCSVHFHWWFFSKSWVRGSTAVGRLDRNLW